MKTALKLLALTITGQMVLATLPGQAQGFVNVQATISGVAASGGYDYTIQLLNTGNEDINSFWYGWTFDGNNLPSNPSNAGNSLGWDNDLDGTSIIWQNSSGTALAPNATASFTFFSTDTPTSITTDPSGGSYAYNGNFVESGDSSPQFSPVLAVPEPSALALGTTGMAGWLLFLRRKKAM
ncbi:MAG TPA: PEP-CTERM sorting domain-containing protein [Candidatus Sulfotelmatobacter sp.]|nr:PEP-CTERM sorting domain-containing protein [Candidatus Sulfotelmatobacter sp.]